MKNKNSLFFIVFILFSYFVKAQVSVGWQPLLLNTDGTTTFDGVEGFYQIITCNSNEEILVMLINHNNYKVKAGWKDFVVAKDEQQLPRSSFQDSITIGPNSELMGECNGKNPQLEMKLTDFGILKEDFQDFVTSNFDFVIIH